MMTAATPINLTFTTIAAEIARIAENLSPERQACLLDYALLLAQETNEATGDEMQAAQISSTGHQDGGRGGYVEIKTIKGHPYVYRRWREGKRLRSQYIGKVKSEA